MIKDKSRDTRLVNKAVLDDPNEFLEAGSSEEFDIICEWTREELVETIQALDQKNFELEAKIKELEGENEELKTKHDALETKFKIYEGLAVKPNRMILEFDKE